MMISDERRIELYRNGIIVDDSPITLVRQILFNEVYAFDFKFILDVMKDRNIYASDKDIYGILNHLNVEDLIEFFNGLVNHNGILTPKIGESAEDYEVRKEAWDQSRPPSEEEKIDRDIDNPYFKLDI